MLILGHVGLTVTAAQAAQPGEDLRLPALFSILPDLVDKPLSLLWPAAVNASSRAFGHSLAGALAVLAALVAARGRTSRTALLWGSFAGHFALDRMWTRDDVTILLWPLRGPFPFSPAAGLEGHLTPYNVCGEALGLFLLLALAKRHGLFDLARLRAFWRTGRLGPRLKRLR